jgi:phospholipid/cholesterol/gamma-HCH transport system substrate-binding protein
MKDRTRNFWVGITAMTGLVGLAYLVFIFGDMPAWTGDFYRIRIDIPDANGLTEGSRIRLAGVDIGQVTSVKLKDNPSLGVQMVGQIDSIHNIPAGSTALAEGSLLGGAAALNIIPPPIDAPPQAHQPMTRDGQATLTANGSSITRQLSQLTQELGTGLGQQLEKFGKVSDSITLMSQEYTALGQRLRDMLTEKSLADVDAGKATPNLYTALARADARLAELAQTTKNINNLLGDEAVIADLRATVSGARRLTDSANEKLAAFVSRYIATADDLSKTLQSLDLLLAEARTGKGTLGKLVNDPTVYDAMTDAINQLNDALKDARLLIQKWKAEGLPVQF